MRPARFWLRSLGGVGTLGAALLLGLTAAPTAPAAPAASRAPAAAVTHEAERAAVSQGLVESNHAGYTGTGFVNYNNVTGSYVEWTVDAAQAGSASLTLRYANGTTANRAMDITVNGTVAAAKRAFPGTGAWTTWTTTTLTAALKAGANTIRATATTANGGPNVDHLAIDAGGPPPGGTTPVEINGQLKVCGTKLCNEAGKPVQLRGMSTHGLQWYSQCVTSGSLDALATDWNADVLRISMYIQEGGYETDPRKFTDLVHSIIEQATARGMYAIVDWHMLSPGDPNVNLARAKTFFTEVAQRHANKKNLLYEIANEPSGVSWSKIKSYAEQLIPVIRQNDPDTPVLVGTRAWSSLGVSEDSDETEIVNNPVNASNIMYTFHFYAASHGTEYLNTLSRAADRLPMFVTEFGTQTASGDGGNNFTQAQKYIDLMASKRISWSNWNYSDDERSGAVFKGGTCDNNGPWTGTGPLKPAGVWVRDRTRTADDFPTG
ncbi:cellulase family glycosylhydrolase [Streptomyces lunaelactis]|uniref:cellulase family glycosylhydrolase n=1 Tax=Streptomyces lunaelactis TaxID=1535768 RepID=UPI0015847CA1|nr:cellulase family glycosylhydrolase [Streptomyces lunaelactis]NUK02822.1 cellulase family glycosylhydrolase [Streptomyces lunaelactis]NUK17166.1 cellulase family glycosylhydrolase [Streptomyces lunaelactis]